MSRETDCQKIEPSNTNTAQVTTPYNSVGLLLKAKEAMDKLKDSGKYVDSVCGEVWGVEGSIDGELASQTLWRLDVCFHHRIKDKLKDAPYGSMVQRQDFLIDLSRQIHNYLYGHPVRKSCVELAIVELSHELVQVEMSPAEFKMQYTGEWPCTAKFCKCGIEWEAMLYGAECGRCGEKRPVSPVAAIKVATQRDN